MASRLATALAVFPQARLLHPTEANGVFVDLPLPAIEALHARGWHFYVFEGETGCRLMCSWDTTPEDIRAFTTDLAKILDPENPNSGS
jgi:threonine aldolase